MSEDSNDAAVAVVGQVLAGKYRVERVIGSGGMGVVVQARHVHIGELVAIKLLRPEMALRPAAAARVLREARAAMRLRSEHVVRVFDVDLLDGAVPFIVMEHLVGRDLARVVDADGPLDVEASVEYVLQACEAVAEAHAMGVVHRDLKPANLFLTRRPDGSQAIKLLDFGVSKLDAAESDQHVPTMGSGAAAGGGRGDSLTSATTALGSPRYMAPEQIRSSRDVDARADVWSLGTILYECLAGRTPFDGESAEEVKQAVLRKEPRPLRQAAPRVPDELEAVVTRCMRKDREKRFGDVAQLASALAPFAPERARASAERTRRILEAQRPVERAESLIHGSTLDERVTVETTGAVSSSARHAGADVARRRGSVVGIVGLVAVGVLAVLAWLWPRTEPVAATTPSPPDVSWPAASAAAVSAPPSPSPVMPPSTTVLAVSSSDGVPAPSASAAKRSHAPAPAPQPSVAAEVRRTRVPLDPEHAFDEME